MTPVQVQSDIQSKAEDVEKDLEIRNDDEWDDPDWEDDLNPKGSDGPESEIELQLRQYKKLEKKLRSLQITYELNKKNTTTLIKENQAVLKSKIKEHKETISEQTTLITKCKTALRQRNNKLAKYAERVEELEGLLKEAEANQTVKEEIQSPPTEQPTAIAEVKKDDEPDLNEVTRVFEAQIEALNQQKKVLHRTGEYYRSLFTCAAEAMLIIDPQSRRIEQSNQAAATLFGMKDTEALNGNTIKDLSPNRQPNNTISQVKIKEKFENAVENGSCVFEHQFTKEDNQTINTIISLGTISNSHANDLIAVIHDISELKKSAEEIPKELINAQQEVEKMREHSRENSEILKKIGNAIQTSLTPVIKTTDELAKEQSLSDSHGQQLNEISNQSRYLIGMTNYLATCSGIASGSLIPTEAGFNLHQFINQIDEKYSKKADLKKLFFASSFAQQKSEHEIPNKISTDPEKIAFILQTLLNYAIEKTNKGRLGLHARKEESIDKNDPSEIIFELAFTGELGKDDTMLNKIFQTEKELDVISDSDINFELALSLQYARLLGGDIALEYRSGNITSLTFTFIGATPAINDTKQAVIKEADVKPADEEILTEEKKENA